ncbi:uncharacterized protein BDR25DRAFT_289456 [Lindgomyces ingoldianus]|uniref:Uncharacterized protein n=1 Tax=Lindgomyces ingoldianus TaxID=673940 RepID=A0ACB6QQT1_9PLEO|nr:uncharacterized protein BDR25DRAFT_289456 [Lindgomyces ingoldianus]KAF2469217.1 hypothetical protein BDR25DRAFT_289456 [Lindgomyces ingoldianus]
MSSKSRALLIASPYGGLRGPENDVELMASVLKKYEFEVVKCCGDDATRNQILCAWQKLISESSADDIVIIYYSGHGGVVKSSQNTCDRQGGSEKPLLSQFLVPMDFDKTTEDDFRGILDIEISYMLRDTTNKTENVTIILDCCHAGRMARDPHHNNQAWARNLPEVKHHGVLLSHMERLRREGHLTGDTFVEGNPHAVRIAAASTTETAWSYQGLQGQPIGVLTEALATAIDKALDQRLSWRTLLLGVSEIVNREFPQQHPRAEGPNTRILFSKEHMTSRALLVKLEHGDAILQGGRVAGVHEGSVYDIMPFGSELVDRETRVAEVKVRYVNGFEAMVEITSGRIPAEGGLAFLQKEALPKLFVKFPDDLPTLGVRLGQSKFLRCGEPGEKQALVNIKKEGQRIVVCKGEMVLTSHQFTDATRGAAIEAIVDDGERLARGHHLLTLGSGENDEKLDHAVEIEFGRVDNGTCVEKFQQDGTANVTENQRVYIKLRNGGNSTVFVSVFDVNVAGTITLVSGTSPRGIELVSDDNYMLGKAQFGGGIRGLGLSWPGPVPKAGHVEETLVFVMSSEEVSLEHLADPKRSIEARGGVSYLERITYHLASGQARDLQPESRGRCIRYAVRHIPFSLRPQQPVQL